MHSSTTADMFTLFPLLAPELRLKIWQDACGPRTLSLRYIPEKDICISSTPPPAILHTTHESRTVALNAYRLSFGTSSHPAHIYFSPHLDTLYRPRWRMMGYDDALRDFRSFIKEEENEWLDQLRRIAVDYIHVEVKRPWEAYNRAVLMRSFPKMEEVVMVLRDENENGLGLGLGPDEEFVEPKVEPESLLRKWVEFRRSFVLEERVLESVAKAMGEVYVQWNLPTVKIRAKAKKVAVKEIDQVTPLALEYQLLSI
jgi:hypothetical protein